MCVARASAAPRAGVESLEREVVEVSRAAVVSVVAAGASRVAAAGAAVGEALAAAAGAAVGEALAAAAVEAAVEADVDETGSFFIDVFSLTTGALRRKCRCFEAAEILPTSHRSGADA